MYCQSCGKQVQESDAFCSSCGTAFRTVPQPKSVQNGNASKPNYSILWFLATLVFLYFAIAFAGGIYVGQEIRQQGGALASAGIALFGMDRAADFVQHNEQAGGGLTGFLALSPTFKWGLEVGGSVNQQSGSQ